MRCCSAYVTAAVLLAVIVPVSLMGFIAALTHPGVPFGAVYATALVGVASIVTGCVLIIVGPE